MLGVTTYITSDVASVPLLWVIPLALYLLTFVLAFTKTRWASLNRVTMVAALVVTLILSSGATEPAWALILANLGFFFVAAMMCHGQLANDRPSVTHLPEYYLWIAVGGAFATYQSSLWPIGLVVGKYRCATVRLITIDGDETAVSDSLKSRPWSNRMPAAVR